MTCEFKPLSWLIFIAFLATTLSQTLIEQKSIENDLSNDLQIQAMMRQLRRFKRAPRKG